MKRCNKILEWAEGSRKFILSSWNIYRMLNRISLDKSRVEDVDWWLCLFWVHLFTKQTRHSDKQAFPWHSSQNLLWDRLIYKTWSLPLVLFWEFTRLHKGRQLSLLSCTRGRQEDGRAGCLPLELLSMPMMHKGTGHQDRSTCSLAPFSGQRQATQKHKTLYSWIPF